MPLFFITNRTSILEKEDWKNVVDLFTNAKQVVTSVQDVSRKLVDYAKFWSQAELLGKTCLGQFVISIYNTVLKHFGYQRMCLDFGNHY